MLEHVVDINFQVSVDSLNHDSSLGRVQHIQQQSRLPLRPMKDHSLDTWGKLGTDCAIESDKDREQDRYRDMKIQRDTGKGTYTDRDKDEDKCGDKHSDSKECHAVPMCIRTCVYLCIYIDKCAFSQTYVCIYIYERVFLCRQR